MEGLARSRGAAPGERPHPRLPPQPDEDSRLLPLLVCLRVLFVPLFMLCHVPERSRLPILFPQDAYFITFMLLFAVSNGYLVSLTMCLAPRSGGWEGEGRAWEWGGGLTLGEGQLAARSLASGQPGPSCFSRPHWCPAVRPGAEERGTRLGGSYLVRQPRPILGPPLWASVSPSVSKQVALSFLRAQLLSHILSCRGPKVEVTSRVPGLLTLGTRERRGDRKTR